jgi:hypothetical protein
MLDTIDLSSALAKQTFKPLRREMLRRIFELSETGLRTASARSSLSSRAGTPRARAPRSATLTAAARRARLQGARLRRPPRTHEKQQALALALLDESCRATARSRSSITELVRPRPGGARRRLDADAAVDRRLRGDQSSSSAPWPATARSFIKFWLHISKRGATAPLPRTSATAAGERPGSVAAEDWEHSSQVRRISGRGARHARQHAAQPYAPWTVVPATDRD